MNNAHKYENNFILKSQKITSLKSDDNDNSKENFNICFSNEIKLDKYYFNKNKKIIYLDKLRIDEKEINFDFDLFNNDIIIINFDWCTKKEEKHMYAIIDINRDFFNSILIKIQLKIICHLMKMIIFLLMIFMQII